MSISNDTEKIFSIKHNFKNVAGMKENYEISGPIKYHYNIPWKIRMAKTEEHVNFYLDCPVTTELAQWSVSCRVSPTLLTTVGGVNTGTRQRDYNKENLKHEVLSIGGRYIVFVINGVLSVEFTVQIDKVTGNIEKKKSKNFDDESSKTYSDMVLKVGTQKFYVCKMYLASHSTYFQSLFSDKFVESQKLEIELKDIDQNDFQYFMELIYGECSVEANNVLGILHLANYFDAKSAIRRCQEYLVQETELPLHMKFEAALKYNLDELMTKCISEMKSAADLESIIPEKANEIDYEVWKELFKKAVSMIPK